MMQLGPAGVEQLAACIDAREARDRADLTVHVVDRVALALVGACMRGSSAHLEHHRDDPEIRRGLARQHACRGATDVGGIEAKSDAVDQRIDVMLREARIGAGAADLRALERYAIAITELRAELRLRRRMRLRHAFDEVFHAQ